VLLLITEYDFKIISTKTLTRLRNLRATTDAVVRRCVLGKDCCFPPWGQAVYLPVVVVQPDERHASRTASVLEWYDWHRAYNNWFKGRRRSQQKWTKDIV